MINHVKIYAFKCIFLIIIILSIFEKNPDERGGNEMKLRRIIAPVLVLCFVLIAGCTGGGSQTPAPAANNAPSGPEAVALKVWVPQNQVDPGTIERMQQQFAAANPQWDITFTTNVIGEDNAKNEILKDVTAAGDVFFFANDQIEDLVSAGAIAQLGGSTEQMVKSTMPEAVVSTVTLDGKLYGIPFTHNTFFMFYDKTLLTEDDVKSLEKIMAKELPPGSYNFQFDPAGGWKGAAFYYGAGLTIYGEDSVSYDLGCDWNSPKGVAVTNYLIDLINNPKCVWVDDASASELAAEHRLGAWWDGPWNYNVYKEALGDNLGLAILPTFNPDGNDYQCRGFYGSKAIGVNALSKAMPAAVAFAAFLGSEEMQIMRFNDTNQAPTNLKAGETAAVKADEVAYITSQEAAYASVAQPTNANFGSNYWANAGGLFTEIKSGVINKNNVQEKLNTFVEQLKVN